MNVKTVENCTVIKKAVNIGVGYPHISGGKCRGYAKSEGDDEPLERCKVCKFLDCCMKNMNEEHLEIGPDGKCETFEEGRSEWYEAEKKQPCEKCGGCRVIDDNQLWTCPDCKGSGKKEEAQP